MTKTPAAPEDQPADPNAGSSAEPPIPTVTADHTQTGINALRAVDPDALRLWTVKGPKGANLTISAVLMDQHSAPRIVSLHQSANGKFAVFEKVEL
jgi:hypothetical protein